MIHSNEGFFTTGTNKEGGLGIAYPFFPSTRGSAGPVDEFLEVSFLRSYMSRCSLPHSQYKVIRDNGISPCHEEEDIIDIQGYSSGGLDLLTDEEREQHPEERVTSVADITESKKSLADAAAGWLTQQ